MKKLFKWVFRLFLVLALVILVLILFLDPIAKAVAERQIRAQTGLEVKIGRVSVGLRSPTLAVEGFRLWNAPEFGDSIFIDVPAVSIRYDLEALRSRRVHLNLVRFNLGELHIVQNKEGRTNLQSLQERKNPKGSASGSTASRLEFEGIDSLVLSIGRLKFTSDKTPAKNEEAYVGIKNETLKNVKSPQDLQPLAARIALEKNLKFISENLFAPATNTLHSAAPSADKGAQNTAGKAPDPLKK
jgi:uncharacterized protein involved in outer membrane biogenesis